MSQKHLKDLLEEDQEPFYLKDYIANKKCMMTKKQQQLQLKKPTKNTSIFSKNACFFSIHQQQQDYSPDLRKSPLFDFSSSKNKSPNRVLLHVPAKTASLLLEAALRIQQKSSKPNNKTHVNKHSSSFGLFGSMLKRLTLRNKTHNKLKVAQNVVEENVTFVNNNVVNVASVSCSSTSSCCNGRSTSSLDLESSSSGRSFDVNDDDNDDGFEFINVLRVNNNNNDDDNNNNNNNNEDYGALCLSPFHFAKSPSNNIFEENVNYEQENSVKCQVVEEEEEDKEQNSPVSVLDPPFEDDYDYQEEDDYDQQQCSYAFVQRAKQQLLHKLQRFEKLAGMDPIELEKRMIEDEETDDERLMLEHSNEINDYDFESFTFANQEHSHLLEDIVRLTGFQDIKKPGIKRLISDLFIEEENVENVCKRLESWKEVECNTIDMMVEMDLRREIGNWKKPQPEITETAIDIEVAIFAVLVKELVADLA